MTVFAVAYERVQPACPSCGRLLSPPTVAGDDGVAKYFSEMSQDERLRLYEVACVEWCGARVFARFWRLQRDGA